MPTRFINPLLLLLVTANRAHLAKQIQYLKAENEVLRARLPEHIRTTQPERAKLLKFGKPLGSAIQDLITIVYPRTFAARWLGRLDWSSPDRCDAAEPRSRSGHW